MTQFTYRCTRCGNTVFTRVTTNGHIIIDVEPCKSCRTDSYNYGYQDATEEKD